MPLILLILKSINVSSLELKWNENASISDWDESARGSNADESW